jgi:uncharacterized protein (TIRG00374 family)
MIGRQPLVKLAIKCLVTALLLWAASRSVDLSAISRRLSGIDPAWSAIALLLTGFIIVSDAMLLSAILRLFARRAPFGTALLYSFVGWFFSNVAPSTIGGDIFRGVQLSRVGTPVGAAVRVILSQRLLSFATLVAVMLAGFPLALGYAHVRRDVLLLTTILAASCGALVILFLVTHFPRSQRLEQWSLFRKFCTLSNDFQRLLVPSYKTAGAWSAALAQHLLRVAILASLAMALGLNVDLTTLFAFTPAALLVAMVPISFGGWGVREVSFVYLLGIAGVGAEAALSLSITFGLLRMMVGAIGGLTWAVLHDDHYRVDAPSG